MEGFRRTGLIVNGCVFNGELYELPYRILTYHGGNAYPWMYAVKGSWSSDSRKKCFHRGRFFLALLPFFTELGRTLPGQCTPAAGHTRRPT